MLPGIAAMEIDAASGQASVRLSLEPATAEAFARVAGLPDGVASGLAPRSVETAVAPDGRPVIVLDPGHGGIDPGAVRGEHTEADLVLTFARELAEALRRTGRVEVVLTREADVFVPLPTRVTIARAAAGGRPDFDPCRRAGRGAGRRGATLYTLSETASDAASAALAEQHDRADMLQGIDLSTSDDVVADVLMDLARVETAPRADALADGLVAAIEEDGLRLHRRPRGEAGFTVLRAADIPSVLLEIGFMSDRGDLENILDPDWRAAMQAALVEGLLRWTEDDANARRAPAAVASTRVAIPRQPDRVAFQFGVLGPEPDHVEAVLRQEHPVFSGIERGVIDNRPAHAAPGLARRRAGREEKRRLLRGMCGKDGKHRALIGGTEVKEGIERHDHVEAPAQRQSAHIGADRLGPRNVGAELRDHRRRAVDPGHAVAPLNEPGRDRLPGAATEVENRQPRRAGVHGGLEGRRFPERSVAVARPTGGFPARRPAGIASGPGRSGVFGVHGSACTVHDCAKSRLVSITPLF